MEKKKGYLMVLIAGIMWGTIGLFTTALSNDGLSASLIACLRLGAGTLMLGILMLATKGWEVFRIDIRGFFWCVLLGIFAEAMFNVSYTTAVRESGMAVAAVLLYTAPIFVCLMSVLFFRETITKKKLMALIVNVAGCALAVTGGQLSGLKTPLTGLIAGLAAGFFFATFTIISTAALKEYDPLTVLFYGMLIGTAILGFVSRPQDLISQSSDVRMWLVVAVYGLIPTCAAYAFYMVGLSKDLETSRVPVISSVEIVTAAVIGTIILQQEITAGKITGILIILLSIVMMNIRFRRPMGMVLRRVPAVKNRI